MLDPGRVRAIVLFAASSVALLLTGYGLIMPIFGRRLGQMGEGVEALGLITMAFAGAQLLAAPLLGSLADRYGRKPLILTALAGFAVANVMFLFADSVPMLIAIRFFEGAATAGLFPAAMGIVGDVVPEQRRAQWVGVIMASYGAGLVLGPAAGGALFDLWGFAAPFAVSATLAALSALFAARLIPETHPRRRRGMAVNGDEATAPATDSATVGVSAADGAVAAAASAVAAAPSSAYAAAEPGVASRRFGGGALASLPRPLYLLATLLLLDFIEVFSFAFIEPQFVVYSYEQLDFSTTQFGLIISAYGLSMVIGQSVLGRVADRIGATRAIVMGFLLTSIFYFGLVAFTTFPLLVIVAVVAGIGAALAAPALGALYLEIAPEEHRSRVMGMKESAASLGAVMGPLLVAGVRGWLDAVGIFTVSAVLLVGGAVLGGLVLPTRKRALRYPVASSIT